MTNAALERLRYHVTGAIQRGEVVPITEMAATKLEVAAEDERIAIWEGEGGRVID